MVAILILSAAALAANKPVFSVERGVFEAPFTLTLSPEQAGDEVWYSLGGGAPDTLYTEPLEIRDTTLVRALEVDAADGSWSSVVTHSYLSLDALIADDEMETAITEDAVYGPIVAETLRTLPMISLVTPYAISTSEVPVSFEWIDPDGDDDQVDCGVRAVGGHSLTYPKSILRLSFRSEYGDGRWDFDLYGDQYPEGSDGVVPEDSFDSITLRSGSHDSVFYLGARGQYLRNLWMDETQLAMGHLVPHGRFAHLSVNGAYRGLYHVRERFDAGLLVAYLGGEEDDYEAVNGGRAVDGDGSAWSQVVAASSSFAEASQLVDMTNFLDYMILNFYAGNDWDWNPTQNWMAAGGADPTRTRFIFHSSDSDICLYYDWTINILHEAGPSYLFQSLRTEGDPDFWTLFADRVHANLEAGGPLTPDEARARYARIAALIEEPVVAESARWGKGWWERDDEWVTEREWLLDEYFVNRADEQLRQLRAAGWYPLDAPDFSLEAGVVTPDTVLTVSVPDGSTADLWLRADGGDPRLSGGATAGEAEGPDASQDVVLEHSAVVSARLLDGDTWGPVHRAFYEVDEAPPLVLNEWNAVEPGDKLKGGGEDSALGRIEGNGGDWIELLVLEDGLDLRGWRITMEDRAGPAGELQFSDAAVLSDLRAGTILTIAEDLPEDPSYDPDGGDWRFHLRAGAEGSGLYVSAAAFDVSHRDWQLSIWDTSGYLRFGPVGEGVAPRQGIGHDEVGLLAADPSPAIRRTDSAFTAGGQSSYGAPNVWEGGEQDLSALRGLGPEPDPVVDTAVVDTGLPPAADDTGGSPPEDSAAPGAKAGGCGCASGSESGHGWWIIGIAALFGRRRRLGPALLLSACAGKAPAPADDTAPGADSADDSAAPPADSAVPAVCYQDADEDGFGDPAVDLACPEGGVRNDQDCDDADRYTRPGVPEVCDGRDNDCDGLIDDADPDLADGLPFYPDGDGDGYGAAEALVTACALGEGLALFGGDCDDADAAVNPGAEELCDDVDQDCDGQADDGLGASPSCAAGSCLEILASEGEIADGAYWILLPSGEAAALWCDMSTDGGGWTLGFLRNTVGTGSQGDVGAGEQSLDALIGSPEEASEASDARMGWIDLNEFDYTELQLGAYGSGSEGYRSRTIPRSALRVDWGDDGYKLYGDDTGYYWCAGDASYTDAGVGAVNNPSGAPSDCKYHGSLGSGWDFSESNGANAGLTLCGGDGSSFLATSWGGGWVYYGRSGGAQAIWVR